MHFALEPCTVILTDIRKATRCAWLAILMQLWRETPVSEQALTSPLAWGIAIPLSRMVTALEWNAASELANARPLPTEIEAAEIVRDLLK